MFEPAWYTAHGSLHVQVLEPGAEAAFAGQAVHTSEAPLVPEGVKFALHAHEVWPESEACELTGQLAQLAAFAEAEYVFARQMEHAVPPLASA